MNLIDSQTITVISIFIYFAFFTWSAYKNWRHLPKQTAILCITTTALFTISGIAAYIKPPTWTTRTIDLSTAMIAMSISRITIDQLLNGRYERKITNEPMIYISIMVTIIISTANYFQKDNMGLFTDNDYYKPTTLFYISHIIQYIAISAFLIPNISIIKYSIDTAMDWAAKSRRFILLCAHLFAIIGISGVALINLAISITIGDTTRNYLNSIYQTCYALTFLLTMISFILPRGLLLRITRPLEYKDELSLWYLVLQLRKVVPNSYNRIHNTPPVIESLIEINETHRIIWTNLQYKTPLNPIYDAKQIYELINTKTTFSNTGNKTPPNISLNNNRNYYLKVAQHLIKINNRSYLTIQEELAI